METVKENKSILPITISFLATSVFWLLGSGIFGALTGAALFSNGFLGSVPAALFASAHLGAGHLGWIVMALMGIYLAIFAQQHNSHYHGDSLIKLIYWFYVVALFIFMISLAFGYANDKRYAELPHVLAGFMAIILSAFLYYLSKFTFQKNNRNQTASYFAFISILYMILYLVGLATPVSGIYLDILVNISTHFLFDGLMLAIMGLTIYVIPKITGKPLYSEFIAMVQLWMVFMMGLFASGRHLVRLGLHPQLEFWAFFYNVLAVGFIFLYFFNIYMTLRQNQDATIKRGLAYRYLVASNIYLGLVGLQGLIFLYNSIYLRELNPKMLVTSHAHMALFGFVTLGVMGVVYYVLPMVTGRGLFSERLGTWAFYLFNGGLIFSVLNVLAKNMIKPAFAHSGDKMPIVDLSARYIPPQYIGDMLLFAGVLLFAVNVFITMLPASVKISKKMLFVVVLTAGLVIGHWWQAPIGASFQGSTGFRVFVANEGEGTISVIDGSNQRLIRNIFVGGSPHNVNTDPRGRYLWVTDHSSKGRVIFIDLKSMKIAAEIPLPGGGGHVVPHPQEDVIYVSVEQSDQVYVIDVETKEITRKIAVGSMPHGLVITPDGRDVFVPNMMSDDITQISHDSGQIIRTISLNDMPEGDHDQMGQSQMMPVAMGVDVTGQHLFVTLAGTHEIIEIESSTGMITNRTKIAGKETPGPIQVPAHPDGKHLYIPSMDTGAVHKIDLVNFIETKTIPTGAGAHGIAFSPGGGYAYVTNTQDNKVSVIDTASDLVVAEIPVGLAPNGVCVLYGANQGW